MFLRIIDAEYIINRAGCPVILAYGVGKDGSNIALRISNFLPSIVVEVPQTWGDAPEYAERFVGELNATVRTQLDEEWAKQINVEITKKSGHDENLKRRRILASCRVGIPIGGEDATDYNDAELLLMEGDDLPDIASIGRRPQDPIVRWKIFKGFAMLRCPRDIRNPTPDTWMRLYLRHPRLVRTVSEAVETLALAECKLDFLLRWIIDSKLGGGAPWVEVPEHSVVPPSFALTTDYELKVDAEEVKSAPEQDTCLGVLCFDIEVVNYGGKSFPDPETHPYRSDCQISHISTSLARMRAWRIHDVENIVWALGEYSRTSYTHPGAPATEGGVRRWRCDVRGAEVRIRAFADEADMLVEWAQYVRDNARIVVGHNSDNFDWRWIFNRASFLGVKNRVRCIGHRLTYATIWKKNVTSSKAKGVHEQWQGNTPGIITDDTFQALKQGRLLGAKLDSNSLSAMATFFLGHESKMDIDLERATSLMETEEGRMEIARYCMWDTALVAMVYEHIGRASEIVEGAQQIGVLPKHIVRRGVQFWLTSQLYLKAKARDPEFVIPHLAPKKGEESYQGATVLPPVSGFYTSDDVDGVAALDFASLYPSIMLNGNICSTTGPVPPEEIERQKLVVGQDVLLVGGHYWIARRHRTSLTFCILEDMLARRQHAKKCLRAAQTNSERTLWDARQRACKVVCNSQYGYLGNRTAPVPCIAAAQAICAEGRRLIDKTRKMVEDRFAIARGIPFDAKVVYGDTDSVFVALYGNREERMGKESVWIWGEIMARYVSSRLGEYLVLENEKFYLPLLLLSKKRYAGAKYVGQIVNGEDAIDDAVRALHNWRAHIGGVTARVPEAPKMDTRGLACVRRDYAPFLRCLVSDVLHKLVIDGDVHGALGDVWRTIAQLREGVMPVDALIMTAQLSRPISEYKSDIAHVALAKKMLQRRARGLVDSAPSLGDRISYIIARKSHTGAHAKKSELVESPEWFLRHSMSPDIEWYITHQMKNPLIQIFSPIFRGKVEAEKKLFSGPHMRRKRDDGIAHIAGRAGPWSAFTLLGTCYLCHASIAEGHGLCKACRASDGAAQVLIAYEEDGKTMRAAVEKMRARCSECSGGDPNAAAKCSSDACTIRWRMPQTLARMEDLRCRVVRIKHSLEYY